MSEHDGVAVPLAPDPPFFGRKAFTHTVFPMGADRAVGFLHVGSPANAVAVM